MKSSHFVYLMVSFLLVLVLYIFCSPEFDRNEKINLYKWIGGVDKNTELIITRDGKKTVLKDRKKIEDFLEKTNLICDKTIMGIEREKVVKTIRVKDRDKLVRLAFLSNGNVFLFNYSFKIGVFTNDTYLCKVLD